MQLLSQLVAIESLELVKNSTRITDWFFKGSPCLLVKFSTEESSFDLYLHPDWVLRQLPRKQKRLSNISPLDKAITNKALTLTIDLEAFDLSLGLLLSLQVGDVLKTQHLIEKPLVLRHQQQIVCQVEPGQGQSYKSIRIFS